MNHSSCALKVLLTEQKVSEEESESRLLTAAAAAGDVYSWGWMEGLWDPIWGLWRDALSSVLLEWGRKKEKKLTSVWREAQPDEQPASWTSWGLIKLQPVHLGEDDLMRREHPRCDWSRPHRKSTFCPPGRPAEHCLCRMWKSGRSVYTRWKYTARGCGIPRYTAWMRHLEMWKGDCPLFTTCLLTALGVTYGKVRWNELGGKVWTFLEVYGTSSFFSHSCSGFKWKWGSSVSSHCVPKARACQEKEQPVHLQLHITAHMLTSFKRMG